MNDLSDDDITSVVDDAMYKVMEQKQWTLLSPKERITVRQELQERLCKILGRPKGK